MKDFAVTFFADFSATTKTEAYLTLDELAAQIRSAKAATKTSAPWVKLARFGDKRSDKGCLRSDENLLAISGVEADYDGERFEFYKAVDVARCAGLAAILYTSPTHRPERPRWRVLCPSSTELLPAHRPRLLNRLHGLYGGRLTARPAMSSLPKAGRSRRAITSARSPGARITASPPSTAFRSICSRTSTRSPADGPARIIPGPPGKRAVAKNATTLNSFAASSPARATM